MFLVANIIEAYYQVDRGDDVGVIRILWMKT